MREGCWGSSSSSRLPCLGGPHHRSAITDRGRRQRGVGARHEVWTEGGETVHLPSPGSPFQPVWAAQCQAPVLCWSLSCLLPEPVSLGQCCLQVDKERRKQDRADKSGPAKTQVGASALLSSTLAHLRVMSRGQTSGSVSPPSTPPRGGALQFPTPHRDRVVAVSLLELSGDDL